MLGFFLLKFYKLINMGSRSNLQANLLVWRTSWLEGHWLMWFLCHSLTIGTKKWNELSPSEDVPFWSSCWQLPRPPWHHFLIVWQLSEMSRIFPTLDPWGGPDALTSGSHTSAFIGITWKACENTDYWAPPQEFLIHQVQKGAQEFIFLRSPQLMLMSLVRGYTLRTTLLNPSV